MSSFCSCLSSTATEIVSVRCSSDQAELWRVVDVRGCILPAAESWNGVNGTLIFPSSRSPGCSSFSPTLQSWLTGWQIKDGWDAELCGTVLPGDQEAINGVEKIALQFVEAGFQRDATVGGILWNKWFYKLGAECVEVTVTLPTLASDRTLTVSSV